MNEVDLAWMAGVFEGEGCIVIARQDHRARNNIHHGLLITLGNTDLALVEVFQHEFGGTFREFSPSNGTQLAWQWRRSGKPAGRVLEIMLGHMRGRKKQQAEAGIEYLEFKEHINRGDVERDEEIAWREAFKEYMVRLGKGEPL